MVLKLSLRKAYLISLKQIKHNTIVSETNTHKNFSKFLVYLKNKLKIIQLFLKLSFIKLLEISFIFKNRIENNPVVSETITRKASRISFIFIKQIENNAVGSEIVSSKSLFNFSKIN